MNRQLTVLLLVTFMFFVSAAYGQKWKLTRYEAIFGLGTTNIFGTIGGTPDESNLYGLKDIRIGETGLSVYAGARYKTAANQAIKFNLIYGFSHGSDVGSKNASRNYSFKTSLFEPSIQYEYYFIGDYNQNRLATNLYNRRGMINDYKTITAYGFLGVGGVFYSPTVTFNGNGPDPRVERVSGYSKMSVVIPVGLGIKYVVDRYWSVGFELGRRFSFSRYLDGIDTNFAHHNDTYYFGVFNAIYKLETDRYGTPLLFKKRRYPIPR